MSESSITVSSVNKSRMQVLERLLVICGIFTLTCYSSIDLFRHLCGGSPYPLVAIDCCLFVMITISCLWLWVNAETDDTQCLSNSRSRISGIVSILKQSVTAPVLIGIALLAAYIIVRFITGVAPGISLSAILALRTYLLPLGMLLTGIVLASIDLDRFRRPFIILLFSLVVLSVLFALVQYWYLSSYDIEFYNTHWGNPLEPAFANFRHYGKTKIYLLSSFFASSKRFGHFIFFASVILWGVLFTKGERPWAVLTTASVVGCFGTLLSGARESFVLYIICFLIFSISRFIRNIWIWIGVGVVTLILVVVIIGMMTRIEGKSPLLERSGEFQLYQVLFSDSEDYLSRFLIAVPVAFIRYDAPDIVWGEGLGTFGQEIRIKGGFEEAVTHAVETRFLSSPAGPPFLFVDAGMTRIIVELGLMGLVLVALLILVTFIHLCRLFYMALRKDDSVCISSILVLTGIFFYTLKAHSTLSEMAIMGFGWLVYGMAGRRHAGLMCHE